MNLNPFRRSVQAAPPVQSSSLAAVEVRGVTSGQGEADGHAHVAGHAPSTVDIWDVLLGVSGPASLSGPEVSPLSTLNVSAVRAAGDLIAGIMGTLPVSIYQIANGGGQEVAASHPGQFLVEQDPNFWTTASELRRPSQRRRFSARRRPNPMRDADGFIEAIIACDATAMRTFDFEKRFTADEAARSALRGQVRAE
jgi:hypothetical protein